RNFRRAEELLNNGVSRIIVGTSTVQNLSFVKEAVQRFGSARVSGAIDARDDEVVIEGWRFGTNVNYLDLAEVLEYSGVGSIIFTSVSRDGTMMGPALDNISKLVSRVKIPVIASGGIRDLGDLLEVARTGIEGVIVGTALYEGSFSLREAIEMVK
ncbi:MAG: HisA/HisF-related TIM barrel protein, partial [Candidatus Bathyarchaeia archaeon]